MRKRLRRKRNENKICLLKMDLISQNHSNCIFMYNQLFYLAVVLFQQNFLYFRNICCVVGVIEWH